MRVLMLTDFYPPSVGGVEQHVRQLGQQLAARGHRVSVASAPAASAARSGPSDQERDGAVTIHRITGTLARFPNAYVEGSRPFAPPSPDPELTVALAKIIKRTRPDVIHSHGWIVGSYLPLAPALGIPLVVTVHDYGLVCAKKSFVFRNGICTGPGLSKCLACAGAHYGPARGTPIVLAEFITGPLVRRAAARFIAVSRAVAEGNRLPASDHEVIPNFLPDDDVDDDARWSTWLDCLPRGPFVLFVGALGAHKGLPVLLEAYRQLDAPPPLVLIGHRWVDTPTEMPPGVVVLEDWPNGAVRAAWRRARIGVIPSTWPEPFGIVALEAMAAGRAVVASAVGGLGEIIETADAGVVVAPGDAFALAAGIAGLLRDEPERERLGANGRRAIEDYRASRVVPRIEAVYSRVSRREGTAA
jgi:glycosyltransferase involved in cell wall biosynthesis